MTYNIEVIMAAYNNVKDMKLVLDGYLRQTDSAFNVCIADDGSTREVADLARLYTNLGLSIRHIWQEDNGFRRAEIVNKAVASSEASQIILTDNDCIPSRHFIGDYKKVFSEGPDKIILGRRVDMYDGSSALLRSGAVSFESLENPFWLLSQAAKKGLKRPEMAIRFPEWICNIWNKKKRGAIGANMGMPKEALMKVNGFDADFQGYGMEETDLLRRLNAAGYQNRTVLGRCALYHLYHIEKMQSQEACVMYEKKKALSNIVCTNGIIKLNKIE
ncbi:glycosyltransferase [Vibrio sp. SCSIO 43133]|uniref:glycosyltransferase n=1 Tax=Vibrio sp. SCSIO 43133 TaxID=2802577 RepID=UPI002075E4AF|nr:glycosyltransferase [Vibrio sp. SCSIO 43133]USE00348.1 glycosyltransferase [Vibrio sp. SCSIO 43133]